MIRIPETLSRLPVERPFTPATTGETVSFHPVEGIISIRRRGIRDAIDRIGKFLKTFDPPLFIDMDLEVLH